MRARRSAEKPAAVAEVTGKPWEKACTETARITNGPKRRRMDSGIRLIRVSVGALDNNVDQGVEPTIGLLLRFGEHCDLCVGVFLRFGEHYDLRIGVLLRFGQCCD